MLSLAITYNLSVNTFDLLYLYIIMTSRFTYIHFLPKKNNNVFTPDRFPPRSQASCLEAF